jgi:hypothetical protein
MTGPQHAAASGIRDDTDASQRALLDPRTDLGSIQHNKTDTIDACAVHFPSDNENRDGR